MITSFEDAHQKLMDREQGYSNNPADPGGETMYGITERVARKNGYKGAMKDLPLGIAKSIAKFEYWNPYQCDQMPPLIAFHIFDAAYNGGHPIQWLQRALNITADGQVGAQTIAAIRSSDLNKTIRKFNGYRQQYLTSLSSWPTFSKGWANRIANNLLED